MPTKIQFNINILTIYISLVGAGVMGAALVKQLTTRGDCVRVVSRVSNKAKKLEQFMQEQQQFALKK